MAEDPYKVLGVARDASDDEIRRVYRKLAKELHPDLNPANRTAAEERFKRVSAAYEIIGDAEKRKKFDRGEI
ncbi:DnaJ domain-containing protein, partial [Vibrio parahaemolyticus]